MKLIKKKLLFNVLVCALIIFSFGVLFTGCNEKEISENNVKTVYASNDNEEKLSEDKIEKETEFSKESTIQKETLTEVSSQIESTSEKTTDITNNERTDINVKSNVSSSNTNNKSTITVDTANQNRIIATSAAVCDIMDRLNIELVGVPETSASSLASRYNNVTRIGTPMAPDMEIIKTLNPTDVIGPDALKSELEMQYNNIGVKSTFINLRSVEGLYDSVKIIGEKYGKKSEADSIINEYNEFLRNYSGRHEGKEKPKVLVLMGLPGSYLVATPNSYAGSLVELAGGINVFQHESKDFLNVNTEEILAKDPDIIIRTAHGLPKEALAMFENEFSTNDIWKHFSAVKTGKVYDVDYTIFGMSATFDYPQALSELESMFYGD